MNTQPAPVTPQPIFPMVYCSQCGNGFGPGVCGFSSCKEHQHLIVAEE